MRTRITERDLSRIVSRVINEESEPKISYIEPKNYDNVKRMILSALQQGKSITITLSSGESTLVGLIDNNTGKFKTVDVTKILP